MELQRVGVVGAGQMGSGIAQVAATAGFEVTLVDLKQEYVDKGMAGIRKSLAKLAEKDALRGQSPETVLARIRAATSNAELAACDLVVEAVVEDVAVKRRLFAELDGIVPPHAILASNTSSIPITVLAAATKRPDRFIGMHFMNPVPLMRLVEVIEGADTSASTREAVVAAGKRMGKEVHACRDFPGFVSNRVLMPMINEAVFCLHEGVARPEDIDAIMKLGMNHPMGPLQLADFIGLDTCLAILNVLHDGFKDPKYRPCPLLVQKVQAGHLGKKSGRGFYTYT
ncbi:MAG TPA: 3-hydroxybutyryl-CoA dehydrogenase [Candidatus Thermoplasmatota archaeon]|nr:3-hydroxybutyryl-CoA dehydrogenase [Candidatus Thermoplasmatota archaeon]